MECLAPTRANTRTCTICGKHKGDSETWFLLTENSWDDRLRIWKWEWRLATRASVHSLCGPSHVRQLVVHWMTTGCLHYPFASSPARPSDSGFEPTLSMTGDGSEPVQNYLAEIAVHREAILRVLQENPLSLNTVLDELMIALEKEFTGEGEPGGENTVDLETRSI